MPTPRTPETLLAAARLYYLQGRSQAEVAQALGTSRSNVSRMLAEAQRQGIVEIKINDPGGRSSSSASGSATSGSPTAPGPGSGSRTRSACRPPGCCWRTSRTR